MSITKRKVLSIPRYFYTKCTIYVGSKVDSDEEFKLSYSRDPTGGQDKDCSFVAVSTCCSILLGFCGTIILVSHCTHLKVEGRNCDWSLTVWSSETFFNNLDSFGCNDFESSRTKMYLICHKKISYLLSPEITQGQNLDFFIIYTWVFKKNVLDLCIPSIHMQRYFYFW